MNQDRLPIIDQGEREMEANANALGIDRLGVAERMASSRFPPRLIDDITPEAEANLAEARFFYAGNREFEAAESPFVHTR